MEIALFKLSNPNEINIYFPGKSPISSRFLNLFAQKFVSKSLMV